jgi:hypothetical protein
MASVYDELEQLADEDYAIAVSHYMNGHCMYLAAALHHTYGLPVEAAWIDRETEESSEDVRRRNHDLFHCWVVLPDGRRFDVKGAQTQNEITANARNHSKDHGWVLKTGAVSIADMERLTGKNLGPDAEHVRLAIDDFNSITPLVIQIERAVRTKS